MQAVTTIEQVRSAVTVARSRGQRVGVVPTMGALHAGHLSLVERARHECDFVVVSVFVNPTQFGPGEDFELYPRPLDADLQACRDAGVHLVFHPAADEMYPAGTSTIIDVPTLSKKWEGAHRPGHFQGVATIVCKLLHAVPADSAYFGQKDYQQQLIIRRMCGDLNMPVEIRTCPTVRESDGLALSSRNAYLSRDQRQAAVAIAAALMAARDGLQAGAAVSEALGALQERLASERDVVPDYAAIVDPETMDPVDETATTVVMIVAARVGTTRLIDNMIVERPRRR